MPDKPPDYRWTDDLFAALRKMADQGLSYGDMEARMPPDHRGVRATRNALIGKMYRAHISKAAPAPVDKKRAAARKSRKYAAGTKAAPKNDAPKTLIWAHRKDNMPGVELRECAPLPPERKTATEPLRVTLMELDRLGYRSCRWPLGNPKEDSFRYCGLMAEECRPYCESHRRIAYTTVAQQKRIRAQWMASRGQRDAEVPA